MITCPIESLDKTGLRGLRAKYFKIMASNVMLPTEKPESKRLNITNIAILDIRRSFFTGGNKESPPKNPGFYKNYSLVKITLSVFIVLNCVNFHAREF